VNAQVQSSGADLASTEMGRPHPLLRNQKGPEALRFIIVF
jgi:hypothetical protein